LPIQPLKKGFFYGKIDMTEEAKPAIYSSTGQLGKEKRSCGRLYLNDPIFQDNAGRFKRTAHDLFLAGQADGITRSVYHGFVSEDVLRAVSNSELSDYLEVAVPVGDFTNDSSNLIYLAKNAEGRTPIVSVEQMVQATSIERENGTSPLQRIDTIRKAGYTFIQDIDHVGLAQVQHILGETFDWKRFEVKNLRDRLDRVKEKPASERDIWFSAIKDGNDIVSLAIAEKLTMPCETGAVDLVESTEWRTKNEYGQNGLMAGTLSALNAQVISDLSESANGTPIIFAECNFANGAYLAGQAAKLSIPDRNGKYPANQILQQNVIIHDGLPIEEGKYRDFIFMMLSMDAIRQYYNPGQIQEMLRVIKS
jgi:hypothetical protein